MSRFRQSLLKKLLPIFLHHWPVVMLVGLWLIAVSQNFSADVWLLGWDSVHPEFDVGLNFSRSIFASWQENYGLGTSTGHGFASLLPHTLVITLLNTLFSTNQVRFIFTEMSWLIGGIGMYQLSKYVITAKTKKVNYPAATGLGAALLYQYGGVTAQVFYLPLEAFTVHYALLPWLLLTFLQFLKNPSRLPLAVFGGVVFFHSVQGFVTPLFASTTILLGFFSAALLLTDRTLFSLKKLCLAWLVFLLVNVFWVVPVVSYYVLNNQAFLNAYNNLQSTPIFLAKSLQYGSLHDLITQQSFFLESKHQSSFVYQPWLDHFSSPVVIGTFYGLFLLANIGAVRGKRYLETWHWLGLAGGGVFFALNLGSSIPVWETLLQGFYNLSPTYEQAFRTPFTKFGISYHLILSLFFAIGGHIVAARLRQTGIRFTSQIIFPMMMAPVLLGLPHWQGSTFYQGLRLSLPTAYQEVMAFFRTQDDGRIAELPADCSDGWYSHNWGYFGSGFYWYGIPQPVLSRSFDVWSNRNEQFFWELRFALGQSDLSLLQSVFDKYQVRWLIFDPNTQHCNSVQGFDYQLPLIAQLGDHPNFQSVFEKDTGSTKSITVLEYQPTRSRYVRTISNATEVVSRVWSNQDSLFQHSGPYITRSNQSAEVVKAFQLFSQRGSEVLKNEIEFSEKGLILHSGPEPSVGSDLQFPDVQASSTLVPVKVSFEQTSGQSADVLLTYLLDQGSVEESKTGQTITIGSVTALESQSLQVFINGYQADELVGAFTTRQPNTVTMLDQQNRLLLKWSSQSVLPEERASAVYQRYLDSFQSTEQITIPRITSWPYFASYEVTEHNPPILCSPDRSDDLTDNRYLLKNGQTSNSVVLEAQNSTQCASFSYPLPGEDVSTLVVVESVHKTGLPLQLSVSDPTGRVLLDVFLKGGKEAFVIPAQSIQNPLEIIVKNQSFGAQPTVNELGTVSVEPVAYDLLDRAYFGPDQSFSRSQMSNPQVKKLNQSLYMVDVDSTSGQILQLGQGVSLGWIAVDSADPWKPLPKVVVNGWSNGWELPAGAGTIYILYWPQLLSFVGLVITTVTLGGLVAFVVRQIL